MLKKVGQQELSYQYLKICKSNQTEQFDKYMYFGFESWLINI